MIPGTVKTDVISQQSLIKADSPVRPVSPVARVIAAAGHDEISQYFVQGQKYQALVEGRLANGNYNVLIFGKLLQMQLPDNTQPGDKLELVLLATHPKLKFSLRSENLLGLAKDHAAISSTGRFLSFVTQESGKPGLPVATFTAAPMSIASITTLIALNSPELPFILQQIIRKSGLFYESHLAKWINGRNTLEELRKEPQGRLKTAASTAAATSVSTIPVNLQSLSLVQQQLAAFETQHIVWNGEIWNGQQMRWEVYQEPATQDQMLDEALPSRWKTKLTLTLPELGKIVVQLSLSAQDVHISIDAETGNTSQLLDISQVSLKQSMHKQGLAVQSFELHDHGQ